MKNYDISNLNSGKYLGEYPGETRDEAVRAMDVQNLITEHANRTESALAAAPKAEATHDGQP